MRVLNLFLIVFFTFIKVSIAQTSGDQDQLTSEVKKMISDKKSQFEIESRLKEILDKNPTNVEATKLLGIQYLERRMYNYANVTFTKLINLDSTNAEFYFLRGRANVTDHGNYEQAIYDFDRAISLGGKTSNAFKNKGTVEYYMAHNSFRKVKNMPDSDENSLSGDIDSLKEKRVKALNECINLATKSLDSFKSARSLEAGPEVEHSISSCEDLLSEMRLFKSNLK